MSAPSIMISPRLTPIRNRIRWSPSKSLSRSSIPRCTSTAQRIDAGEFDQHAVAGSLDDPAAVFGNFGVEELATVRL
jgi:hypothetical protein